MELEKESREKREAGLTEDKNNKLDHLTKIIGPFGPFHAIIYTAIGLSIVIHGWQMFSNKFYTYKTNFWCAKPNSLLEEAQSPRSRCIFASGSADAGHAPLGR